MLEFLFFPTGLTTVAFFLFTCYVDLKVMHHTWYHPSEEVNARLQLNKFRMIFMLQFVQVSFKHPEHHPVLSSLVHTAVSACSPPLPEPPPVSASHSQTRCLVSSPCIIPKHVFFKYLDTGC